MVNKKESGFCRKWTSVSMGERGIFFSGVGVGGFFKLSVGSGCLLLGWGWCSNYWKIMGGGVQSKIS